MTTLSHDMPSAPIGRSAASRAGRDAASTLAAICAAPLPPDSTPAMAAWAVMRSHVDEATSDDEAAAVVRSVLAELRRIEDAL